MAIKMQQRRGTAAEWTSANPTLAAGEIGFETDTNKFKIGDGSTVWESLKYYATATDLQADITATSPIVWTANPPGVSGTQATISFNQSAQNTTNDARYVKLTGGATNVITSPDVNSVPLTINAIDSQAVNLQNWKVNGVTKASIDQDGDISTTGTIAANGNITSTAGNIEATAGSLTSQTLRVTSTTDATTTSTTHGVQVGPDTGADRLVLDSNEIHVYNGSTPATLTVNGDGGSVFIASAAATTTVNGPLVTATGNTTGPAPLRIPAATNLLGTPTAGVVEYDGKSFYATPNATSGRAYIPQTHYFALTTARTQATPVSGTAYDLFGQKFTVAANTAYEFEMQLTVSNPGTVANTLNLLFALADGASLTSIGYSAVTTNGTSLSTPNATSASWATAATAFTVCASVAAATARTVIVKGTIRTNAAGSIRPQYSHTGAPGNTTTIGINSYIKLTPLGSDTVTSVGTWAA